MSDVLLDVDGVLLDWIGGFREYLSLRGIVPKGDHPTDYSMRSWLGLEAAQVHSLITSFNTSPYFERLQPCPGAVDAVSRFHDLGLDITVISSCGREMAGMRRRNLRNVFGGNMGVICLDLHESKLTTLAQFDRAIWVEDHDNHAWAGAVHGHRSFCFRTPYNAKERTNGEDVQWIEDWHPVLEAARDRAAQKHASVY